MSGGGLNPEHFDFSRIANFPGIFGRKQGILLGVWLCVSILGFAGCTPRVQDFVSQAVTPSIANGAVVVSDGTRLPLRTWKSEGPETHVIIALHGFNDYSNAFTLPAAWWSSHGVPTYAYDQRGFGSASDPGIWPGIQNLVQDLYDVIEAVRVRHPDASVVLAGSSMGGAVVLAAYGSPPIPNVRDQAPSTLIRARTPPSVQGAILSAPAVWGRATMNPVYRAVLWLMAHIAPAAHVSGRNLNITPSDNIEMLRALSKDPLVIKNTRTDSIYGLVNLMDAALDSARRLSIQALVLYGDKDEIIPRGATRLMVERLEPRHRFVLYPDGYHMLFRDLQAETVWRDTLAWIRDPDGVLPSGQGRDARAKLAQN